MIYTGLKMVEIELNGNSRVYFPEIQALRGKKILTINSVSGIWKYTSTLKQIDFNKTFLNIAQEDAVTYSFQEVALHTIDTDVCKGINLEINRVLSIENCYINNPNNLTGCAIFVIAYELVGYSKDTSTQQKFDVLEVPVKYGSGFKNQFPDNRTLFNKGIQTFNFSEVTASPTGNDCVTDSNTLNALFLTLTKGIYRIWDAIPMKYFRQSGWYERMNFNNLVFDCDNSFIEIGAYPNPAELKTLCFNVEYKD